MKWLGLRKIDSKTKKMAANRQKNGRKSTKKWPQIEDPKIYLREVENMWAPGLTCYDITQEKLFMYQFRPYSD